jgi:hypothetical protein
MKVVKKTSVAGAYARKEAYNYEGTDYEADIKNGDMVEILNKGDVVTGEYGDQYVFQIKTRNGEKNANFNQSSINALIDAYGDDTESWVGKEVKVLTKKGVYGGKKGIAAYFVPANYILNEYGELEVTESEKTVGDTNVKYPESETSNGDGTTPVDDEIKPEDIPF